MNEERTNGCQQRAKHCISYLQLFAFLLLLLHRVNNNVAAAAVLLPACLRSGSGSSSHAYSYLFFFGVVGQQPTPPEKPSVRTFSSTVRANKDGGNPVVVDNNNCAAVAGSSSSCEQGDGEGMGPSIAAAQLLPSTIIPLPRSSNSPFFKMASALSSAKRCFLLQLRLLAAAAAYLRPRVRCCPSANPLLFPDDLDGGSGT